MTTDKEESYINELIKEIENEMINGILEYVRNSIFPNNNPTSRIKSYELVVKIVDDFSIGANILFDYHNKIIKNFVIECRDLLKNCSTTNFCDSLINYTKKFNLLTFWMNKIFNYLDKLYTTVNKKGTLYQNSAVIYKYNFFDYFQEKIFKEINILIREDRNGNFEIRPKIKCISNIIQMMDSSNPKMEKENDAIYWIFGKNDSKFNYQNKWYEEYFKKETENFAKLKANSDIHNMTFPEYISSQLKYIAEEKKRQLEYINPKYHIKIDVINYFYLIGNRAKEIARMDSGIIYFFKNQKREELKNAYELFTKCKNCVDEILPEFTSYILSKGKELDENKEKIKDARLFFQDLINLKKEIDIIVSHCFNKDYKFINAKDTAFSKFMKKTDYSKKLANYTDFCMRSKFKGKSQEEIENELNDIIYFFKLLESKNWFIYECEKKTSERLIKNLSLSINNEKLFISKLKQESFYSVSKMQEMIKDLENSKKEMDLYKLSESKGMPSNIRFNVQIISQSAWVINTNVIEEYHLPKFLEFCKNDFYNYYHNKHNTQKLIWCLGLSKIEVQYLYLENKNISISTLPQILILLQLEQYGKLTLGNLAKLLGCKSKMILDNVQGLIFNPSFNPIGLPDKGIVMGNFNKETKEFKEEDEISINKDLIISRKKFNTFSLKLKKNDNQIKEEELHDSSIIKKEQIFLIQSTLTRILKSRIGKITTHAWLLSETSKQIDRFKAQPQQIKENIEKLIGRNIIKRAENSMDCYEYIA